jgi:uncharacterized protein with von Willebrand factor type A (vWA) domain
MELMLSEKKKHKVFLGWLLLHSILNTREIYSKEKNIFPARSQHSKGIHQEFWITTLKTNEDITLKNIAKFVELWTKVNEVQLTQGTADEITWKFTTSGSYMTGL